ncbi:MAG: hypothetical protein GY792_05190 [Gammaproteobacteria bacterium]|nr:hypothetical protein [Gammaproteobacteria bacterium]
MARSRSQCAPRITLQLDNRIALEAIILNRIERVPARRRQEWLRGLLVEGFRAECRLLRTTAAERENSHPMDFSCWLAVDSQGNPQHSPPVALSAAPTADLTTNGKPFAGLDRVIG